MMPRAVAVAIIVPLLVGLAAGDLISEPAPTPAVVAPVPATAPCAAALESTGTQAIGAFVPQCDEGGGYEPRQCSGSTGYCWCVDAEGTAISEELPSWEEGASTAEDCAALRESTGGSVLVTGAQGEGGDAPGAVDEDSDKLGLIFVLAFASLVVLPVALVFVLRRTCAKPPDEQGSRTSLVDESDKGAASGEGEGGGDEEEGAEEGRKSETTPLSRSSTGA